MAGFALPQLLVGDSKVATMGANATEGIMKRLAMLCASVVAALVLTANCAPAKSIHYDASKSNTGNVTAHRGIGMTSGGTNKDPPNMAVKGPGVPQNGKTLPGKMQSGTLK
jgi:hypothetical protein